MISILSKSGCVRWGNGWWYKIYGARCSSGVFLSFFFIVAASQSSARDFYSFASCQPRRKNSLLSTGNHLKQHQRSRSCKRYCLGEYAFFVFPKRENFSSEYSTDMEYQSLSIVHHLHGYFRIVMILVHLHISIWHFHFVDT